MPAPALNCAWIFNLFSRLKRCGPFYIKCSGRFGTNQRYICKSLNQRSGFRALETAG